METIRCFKFLDPALNGELLKLIRKANIKHSVNNDGAIHYCASDDDFVENALICSVRDRVFPSWQVLTCPSDWIATYRDYIAARRIPFREELSDGEVWFLIPGHYRPNSWKLRIPMKTRRLAI